LLQIACFRALQKAHSEKYAAFHGKRNGGEMPFPVQRIQTDRGAEFFAIKVQEYFIEQSIKFRPIKPGAPHLNGKVGTPGKPD
jgi:hypothetical protein